MSKNQCDGCVAGMPLHPLWKIHMDKDEKPYMVCTKSKYVEKDTQTHKEEHNGTLESIVS